jgi:hypothetical protein
MANFPGNRRAFVRRMSVLLTLMVAGGGLVALEHTATGATTGTPSSSGLHVTTEHEGEHGKHHGSTTSTSSTTTASTTTTTSMPKDPGKHCHVEHGRHHDKKFRCRPPSGGTGGTGGTGGDGHDNHHHEQDHSRH